MQPLISLSLQPRCHVLKANANNELQTSINQGAQGLRKHGPEDAPEKLAPPGRPRPSLQVQKNKDSLILRRDGCHLVGPTWVSSPLKFPKSLSPPDMKVLRDGLVLASTLALTVRPGAAWQMDSSCDKYGGFFFPLLFVFFLSGDVNRPPN